MSYVNNLYLNSRYWWPFIYKLSKLYSLACGSHMPVRETLTNSLPTGFVLHRVVIDGILLIITFKIVICMITKLWKILTELWEKKSMFCEFKCGIAILQVTWKLHPGPGYLTFQQLVIICKKKIFEYHKTNIFISADHLPNRP